MKGSLNLERAFFIWFPSFLQAPLPFPLQGEEVLSHGLFH
jgi:hypothetical protein